MKNRRGIFNSKSVSPLALIKARYPDVLYIHALPEYIARKHITTIKGR